MIASRSWVRLLRLAVMVTMLAVSAAVALSLVPAELSAVLTASWPVAVVATALRKASRLAVDGMRQVHDRGAALRSAAG